jgi:hypothetical protein
MPYPRIELAQPLAAVRQPVQLLGCRVGHDDLRVSDPHLEPAVVDAAKALEDLPANGAVDTLANARCGIAEGDEQLPRSEPPPPERVVLRRIPGDEPRLILSPPLV